MVDDNRGLGGEGVFKLLTVRLTYWRAHDTASYSTARLVVIAWGLTMATLGTLPPLA
jgi:hypothetical protein